MSQYIYITPFTTANITPTATNMVTGATCLVALLHRFPVHVHTSASPTLVQSSVLGTVTQALEKTRKKIKSNYEVWLLYTRWGLCTICNIIIAKLLKRKVTTHFYYVNHLRYDLMTQYIDDDINALHTWTCLRLRTGLTC